jgi:tryptophan-rich sensory protein
MIGTLKDVSLGIGIVGFTYWQWTWSTRRYEMKSESLPRWIFPVVWILMYACLSVAWALLLFKGTETQLYVLPNLILLLVGLVLNKLWTVLVADMVVIAPRWTRVFTIAGFIDLLCMIGVTVAFLTLTALDGAWFPFGFTIPYAIWLVIAAGLSLPIGKRLIGFIEPCEIEIRKLKDDTPSLEFYDTTQKRIPHSGLKIAH